jgi:queuine tRNA-ribosyltransferase
LQARYFSITTPALRLQGFIEMNKFEVLYLQNDSAARQGLLTTAHGKVETPVFCPIGTAGAIKGITPQQLQETGTNIILANTYHLLLRPGVETIEKLGGLHKFMAWNNPIFTDSGGYQIFSLGPYFPGAKTKKNASTTPPKKSKNADSTSPLTKIDDDGVEFVSHVDGAKIHLNAEIATNIQNRLGADIIMCFDQCTPFPCNDSQLKKAVERTIRWALVCKHSHANANQLLFAIVQGGINLKLRTHCARELVKMDFDGYAIGGLSVGEGHDNMIKTVMHTTNFLPQDKPRYLMGAGTPADIIAAVRSGIDIFDCVLPTRNGRNAFAFTDNGPLHLRNNAHINDANPIDADCDCYCCRNFSRGALRHFFNVGEMLGPILVSLHNIRFYQKLMTEIRQTIKRREFTKWATEQLKKYEPH